VLAVFSLAPAAISSNLPAKVHRPPASSPEAPGRIGGENFDDAAVIAALPFTDTGNTCGFLNDFSADCPYLDNSAPDVVYRFEPSTNRAVSIDLCSSLYDTNLLVYEDNIDRLVGCIDDAGCGYSGWQSRIDWLGLGAGHVYYIVVDGYGNECGNYVLVVTDLACEVACPAGALVEGEPPCGDDYSDQYNSGCATALFTPIPAQDGTCAVMCGRLCTYFYNGSWVGWDRDWYSTVAAGGPVQVSVTAEFPLAVRLFQGTDCESLAYVEGTAAACGTVDLVYGFAADQPVWFEVSPGVMLGVPESDYTIEVCGIQGVPPTPVVPESWGRLKCTYR
jgi:hypothetical protein